MPPSSYVNDKHKPYVQIQSDLKIQNQFFPDRPMQHSGFQDLNASHSRLKHLVNRDAGPHDPLSM